MKLEIQGFWGAEVKTCEAVKGLDPENILKKGKEITLAMIAIDGKCVGSVTWDGNELGIEKPIKERKGLKNARR